jgi:hypothetical protein
MMSKNVILHVNDIVHLLLEVKVRLVEVMVSFLFDLNGALQKVKVLLLFLSSLVVTLFLRMV